MIRLVDKQWSAELTDGLRVDTSALRVVCPFIKAGALDRLSSLSPGSIQVVTRFNLDDLAEGGGDRRSAAPIDRRITADRASRLERSSDQL